MKKIVKFDNKIDGKTICNYLLSYNHDEHTLFGIWVDETEKDCIIEVIEKLNRLNRCNIQIIDNTSENKKKQSKINKNTIKVDIHSVDGDEQLFNKYVEILYKYSINNKVILTKDEYDCKHAIIEINSLSSFLVEFENNVCKINNNNIDGLIFSTVDENYYSIEIYDGCRE